MDTAVFNNKPAGGESRAHAREHQAAGRLLQHRDFHMLKQDRIFNQTGCLPEMSIS